MAINNGIRKLAFRATSPRPRQALWLEDLINSAKGMSTNLGIGAGTGAVGGILAGPPTPYTFNEYGQPMSPGYGAILRNSLSNALVGGAAGAALGGGYYGINRALSRVGYPAEIRVSDQLSAAIPLPKYVLPTPKYISPGMAPTVNKMTPTPQIASSTSREQILAQTEAARQAVAKNSAQIDAMRRSNPSNFSQGTLPYVDNTSDPAELARIAKINQYEEAKAVVERYNAKLNDIRMQKSMRVLPGYNATPSDILVKNMTGIDPSNINDARFRKMSALQETFIRDVEKTAAAKLRGIYAHQA